MPADTSVKYFHSGMSGAPQTSLSAGSLISVLDACLVNGFSSQTVDSITVASGIATVTRAAGHPFGDDNVVEIAGATPSGLNGQKRVLTFPSATSYTFDATGVADGAATGSITHKFAPAGWSKPFSGTNLAAYRALDVASTGCYLRVDDTDSGGSDSVRVTGYQTMTGISTGDGPFPTLLQQVNNAGYWNRATAGGSSWALIADTRGFYLYINPDLQSRSCTYFFGDIQSRKSPDPYACLLTANTVSMATSGGVFAGDAGASDPDTAVAWLSASYVGLGGSKAATLTGLFPVGLTGVGLVASGSVGAAYPNGADNGLILTPMCVGELSPNCWRGTLPGMYFCPQAVGTGNFAHLARVTDVAGLAGRALRAFVNSAGPMFIDVSGPWAR